VSRRESSARDIGPSVRIARRSLRTFNSRMRVALFGQSRLIVKTVDILHKTAARRVS
jgi:hypothetical protein